MPQAIDAFPSPGTRRAVVTDSRPTGVFATLCNEHREITAVMRRLLETPESEAKTRRNLWAEIEREVLAHDRAESLEVYRAVDGIPSLNTATDEHIHHAHLLEALIDELNAIPMQSPLWRLTFERFEAAVKQHARDEEADFFPRAQTALGRDKSQLLEVPYLAAKRAVKKLL